MPVQLIARTSLSKSSNFSVSHVLGHVPWDSLTLKTPIIQPRKNMTTPGLAQMSPDTDVVIYTFKGPPKTTSIMPF